MNQEVLCVGFHIWILLNIIAAGYSVFLNLHCYAPLYELKQICELTPDDMQKLLETYPKRKRIQRKKENEIEL